MGFWDWITPETALANLTGASDGRDNLYGMMAEQAVYDYVPVSSAYYVRAAILLGVDIAEAIKLYRSHSVYRGVKNLYRYASEGDYAYGMPEQQGMLVDEDEGEIFGDIRTYVEQELGHSNFVLQNYSVSGAEAHAINARITEELGAYTPETGWGILDSDGRPFRIVGTANDWALNNGGEVVQLPEDSLITYTVGEDGVDDTLHTITYREVIGDPPKSDDLMAISYRLLTDSEATVRVVHVDFRAANLIDENTITKSEIQFMPIVPIMVAEEYAHEIEDLTVRKSVVKALKKIGVDPKLIQKELDKRAEEDDKAATMYNVFIHYGVPVNDNSDVGNAYLYYFLRRYVISANNGFKTYHEGGGASNHLIDSIQVYNSEQNINFGIYGNPRGNVTYTQGSIGKVGTIKRVGDLHLPPIEPIVPTAEGMGTGSASYATRSNKFHFQKQVSETLIEELTGDYPQHVSYDIVGQDDRRPATSGYAIPLDYNYLEKQSSKDKEILCNLATQLGFQYYKWVHKTFWETGLFKIGLIIVVIVAIIVAAVFGAGGAIPALVKGVLAASSLAAAVTLVVDALVAALVDIIVAIIIAIILQILAKYLIKKLGVLGIVLAVVISVAVSALTGGLDSGGALSNIGTLVTGVGTLNYLGLAVELIGLVGMIAAYTDIYITNELQEVLVDERELATLYAEGENLLATTRSMLGLDFDHNADPLRLNYAEQQQVLYEKPADFYVRSLTSNPGSESIDVVNDYVENALSLNF